MKYRRGFADLLARTSAATAKELHANPDVETQIAVAYLALEASGLRAARGMA